MLCGLQFVDGLVIVVYVLQKLVDLRFGIADFRTFTEKLGQRIFQFCYFVQGKSLQSF